MTEFTPPPGWHEVERPVAAVAHEALLYRAPRGTERRIRAYVRDEEES